MYSLYGIVMRCLIIYWSRYGHGERLIEYLSEKLENNKIKIQIRKPDTLDPKNMPEADLYIFSYPTEAFRIRRDMRIFMKKLTGLEHKSYGILNTHFMNKNWLKSMEKILTNKKKMKKLAEIDFQIEKQKVESGEGLPKGWKKDIEKFVEEILSKYEKS